MPFDDSTQKAEEIRDETVAGANTAERVGAALLALAADALEYVDDKKLDDLSSPEDNTDLDATTGHHGLMPKAAVGQLAAAKAKTDFLTVTAATDLDAARTKLAGIEAGATADQTATEIASAYETQRSVISQAEAEAGVATTVRLINAIRIRQAIDARIAEIIDASPGTLDTLNELAAALGDDPNFAATVASALSGKLPLAGGTMAEDAQISTPDGSWRGQGTRTRGGIRGLGNVCAVGYEEQWVAGSRYVHDGGGNVRETTNQFSAPTVYDDTTKGYIAGSRWVEDSGKVWRCAEATENAALWIQEVDNLPFFNPLVIDASLLPMSSTRFVQCDNEDWTLPEPTNGADGQKITLHLLCWWTNTVTLDGSVRLRSDQEWDDQLRAYQMRVIELTKHPSSWIITGEADYNFGFLD